MPTDDLGILFEIIRYSPGWFIAITLVVALAKSIPTISAYLSDYLGALKQSKDDQLDIARLREERKKKESEERSQRDGQYLQLQEQSNHVIQQNTEVIQLARAAIDNNTLMMESLKDERDSIAHALDDLHRELLTHDKGVKDVMTKVEVLDTKIEKI